MAKGTWVTIGPTAKPYCEVVADDSGMVYVSVQSGAVRTSDYLTVDEAEQLGRALLSAVARQAATPATAAEAEETCEWCGRKFPKSEMNSIEWGGDPNRIKRICDRCCDESS